MRPTLPLGDRKTVNSNTSRSTGCGATVIAGADAFGADRVADAFGELATDEALDGAGAGEVPHAASAASVTKPATVVTDCWAS
jgi:hypothetical protein